MQTKINYPKDVNLKLEFTSSPKSEYLDFLTKQINQETPQYGTAYRFAFNIKDNSGQVIAGLNGSVIYNTIYTDQLWVHPAHRKKGLGNKLMEAVHTYGINSKCSFASVSTMSFQGALGFYKKMGYLVDFERYGYTSNSCCYFLVKKL
jgi:ribosomal protein S18 acetylase RimI-like enzyme